MDFAICMMSPLDCFAWLQQWAIPQVKTLVALGLVVTAIVLKHQSHRRSTKRLRDLSGGAHEAYMSDGRTMHWKLPSVRAPLQFCRAGHLATAYSLQRGSTSLSSRFVSNLSTLARSCDTLVRNLCRPRSPTDSIKNKSSTSPQIRMPAPACVSDRHLAGVAFTGIELDTSSIEALRVAFHEKVPAGWLFHVQPMSICRGPLAQAQTLDETSVSGEIQERLHALSVDQQVTLQIAALGQNEGVLAVKVFGCCTTNTTAHIAIACAPGHHPFESNYITEWKALQEEMLLCLSGRICEFATGPEPIGPSYPKPLLRTLSGYRHCGYESRDHQSENVTPLVPRLVRGMTGHSRNDLRGIGEMVANILQDDGWKGVNRESILVDDKSGCGYGGSKTYKVTAPGMDPSSVALHSRSEVATSDPIAEKRMETAASLFAQAGLSPQRLAQGGDWFIEPWMGDNVGTSKDRIGDDELLPKLAALLADIHKLPTKWYDPWRRKIIEHIPALREASLGSHIWWYTTPISKLQALSEESLQRWATVDFFAPVQPAAARIVCCHGDFHPANIIQTDSGLKIIDFEYSCVGSSVMDVAWAMSMWLKDTAQKRRFVQTYLQHSDLPSGCEEVDAFILDAEIAYLGQANCIFLWKRLERKDWHQDFSYDLQLFHAYKAFVKEVRASPALRCQVIEKGFHTCSEAWLSSKIGPPILESHWCALPIETEWRRWAEENNGLALQPPQQTDGGWRVWCFCGMEMHLRKLHKSRVDVFHCHCGQVGERVLRPAGFTMWECIKCKATASVADPSSGKPRGIPASPACRALRYQGHALIDCLRKNYAYQSVLPKDFHFASAGVAESVKAISQLREALVALPRKNLLWLQDDDVGVANLTESISKLQPGDAEVLLHGYANAGRARLVEVLLRLNACDVNFQRAKDGCTALHLAYFRNHEDVIAVLEAYGADPSIKSKYGETPTQAAPKR